MKSITIALAIALAPALVFAAERIVQIADVKRGSMVTVQGTVERITDEDEFRLADASGSILVYVGPIGCPPTRVRRSPFTASSTMTSVRARSMPAA